MNNGEYIRDIEYGEVYWVKYGTHPFWPVRRALVQEVSDEVLLEKRKGHILIYFFGSHNYCWIEPRTKALRFLLGRAPPGAVPKFSHLQVDLEKQYNGGLLEARNFVEAGNEERDTSEMSEENMGGESETEKRGTKGKDREKEKEKEKEKEEGKEIEEISDTEGGKEKNRGNEKDQQHKNTTRRADSDSDDFKRSSGENQRARTPRKKQTKKKPPSRSSSFSSTSKAKNTEDPIIDSEREEEEEEGQKPQRRSSRIQRRNSKNNMGDKEKEQNTKKHQNTKKRENAATKAENEENDKHSSEEVDRPKKKRRAKMVVGDDSGNESEEKTENNGNNKKQLPPQFIDLVASENGKGKRGKEERGGKRRASASALVSIPTTSTQEPKNEPKSDEDQPTSSKKGNFVTKAKEEEKEESEDDKTRIQAKAGTSEDERKEKKEGTSEDERKEKEVISVASSPVHSPPLQTTPASSEIAHSMLDFEETYDSQEQLYDDPPPNSTFSTNSILQVPSKNSVSSANTSNSTSSKNSIASKNSINSLNSATSTNSLNSHSSGKSPTNNAKTKNTQTNNNNIRGKYLITSDDEYDTNNNRELLEQLEKSAEMDKKVMKRSQSEGIATQYKDSYINHSDNTLLSHHDPSPPLRTDDNEEKEQQNLVTIAPQHNSNKNDISFYNNQSDILNPIMQSHKIPFDDISHLNSQYPPPYNKNNSFYINNNKNNYNNNIDETEQEEKTEQKIKQITSHSCEPTQTYHNSPETSNFNKKSPIREYSAKKQSSAFHDDVDHVVADSQVPSYKPGIRSQHVNLQSNDLVSESNISTLEANECDGSQGDKKLVEDITPTMRVHHTVSQCQPVPPSQLATPSAALASNFNFYSSPVTGVMDYYAQRKKKKTKESSVSNTNNNSEEKQIQNIVSECFAKERTELENSLKKEFEQKYSAAIEELKIENADLRVQIDKLSDELVVTRAEFAALSKDLKEDKKKVLEALVKQIEEQETNLKNIRETIIPML